MRLRHDTSLARSMPSSPGQAARHRRAARRGRTRRPPNARSRRWARRRRGSAGSARACRCPTGRSARAASSSRRAARSLRKFDGAVTSSRTISPARAASSASTSSALAPTLPICGKVKVMICPAKRRVGHDLLIAGHRGVEAHLADRLRPRRRSRGPRPPRRSPEPDTPVAPSGAAMGLASAMVGRALRWFGQRCR